MGNIKWHCQKMANPEVLILDCKDKAVHLPEDLIGRLHRSDSLATLVISNPTAEDNGVYTWRRQSDYCSETIHKDPHSIYSPFYKAYASLKCCVLLAMVFAVILVYLRTKRKEPGLQGDAAERHWDIRIPEWRGGQKGDRDLPDDLGKNLVLTYLA